MLFIVHDRDLQWTGYLALYANQAERAMQWVTLQTFLVESGGDLAPWIVRVTVTLIVKERTDDQEKMFSIELLLFPSKDLVS